MKARFVKVNNETLNLKKLENLIITNDALEINELYELIDRKFDWDK